MSSFFAAHHPSLAAVAAEGTGTHHHRAAAARYYHPQMHHSPYAATAASHGELWDATSLSKGASETATLDHTGSQLGRTGFSSGYECWEYFITASKTTVMRWVPRHISPEFIWSGASCHSLHTVIIIIIIIIICKG
jgi:hypothetical protein